MKNPLSADLDHVLEHTRELWDELRGERIFITGGTGFFGCWLLESLIWANKRLNINCQAVVLSRSPDIFKSKAPHLAAHKSIFFIHGDVRTFDFPLGNFSHFIHAATESSARINAESPLLMFDTIVEGTSHTLEFAKKCGAQNFLLTSSGAVYGKQPPEMTHIPEEYSGAPDPLNPESAYGEGKRVAEHLCALYRDAYLKPKIARCFAFVGPYLPLDIHFAIGNFIGDALHGGPIIIRGDGAPRRSYLYASDLVIWLWTILIRGETLHPYNVGSDEILSIAEAAEKVVRWVTEPVDIKIIGKPTSNQITEYYVPLISRARNELKLDVFVPLDEGVKRTIEFYRKN